MTNLPDLGKRRIFPTNDNDRDTIEEAYAGALRNLFNVLLDAFVEAPQDQKLRTLPRSGSAPVWR